MWNKTGWYIEINLRVLCFDAPRLIAEAMKGSTATPASTDPVVGLDAQDVADIMISYCLAATQSTMRISVVFRISVDLNSAQNYDCVEP